MSEIVSSIVIFTVVSLCLLTELGSAFNIKIDPDTITESENKDVSISCGLDSTDSGVEDILFIDVSRDGNDVAAFRQGSPEASVAERVEARVKAEGKIDRPTKNSYLRVTLSDPRVEDAGEYVCTLYYKNQTVKDKTASANLTIITKNKNADKELATELRRLVDEVDSLKKELKGEKSKSGELLDKVLSLTGEINSLEEHMDNDNSTVMFAAHPTRNFVLDDGSVLIFDRVTKNIGQAFSGKTGVFTAPVAGFYLFQVDFTPLAGRKISLDIISSKPFRRLSTVLAGDKHYNDQSSRSVVAKLQAGEAVKCVVDSSYYGVNLFHTSPYLENQFSGYLLKTL